MGGLSIIHWLIVIAIIGGIGGIVVMLLRRSPPIVIGGEPHADSTRLSHVATILTWTWLATDAAITAASLYTIKVLGGLGGAIAPMEQLQNADRFGTAIGIIYTIAFVASGIAILRWIYVTNRDAHSLGGGMTISPGWAVGWFFVPIASLWKPFGAVRESWQTTTNPDAPDTVPIPALLRWWWGLWVITSILGNIEFRLSMAAKTADALITANWFSVIALPIDIGLTIALVTIMPRLSRMQRDAAIRSQRADVDDPVG